MTTPSSLAIASPTPAQLGFRMPPEWAPHEATWLSWPHNLETWPEELPEVESVMAQAVKALASGEAVYINVLGDEHERHVRSMLDDAGVGGEVRFFHIPTNDAWIRDHGAIFVRNDDGRRLATCWGFNSWGEKYPPFDLDDRVPEQMASALGVQVFDGGIILEGGSIEVSSDGVLLTTEACLLNPNRNPALTKSEVEDRLRLILGVSDIVWLGDGIVGDDTDGHVDDVTRFVDDRTIITAVEPDESDENHEPLAENLERLRGLRRPDGHPYRIVELPMPSALTIRGDRMPASYANFYIGNSVVLMPAFDDEMDRAAEAILEECFPSRKIVSLDCRRLIWGLGAFHCLTQQVPR
jgi:agmatine deiminase